MSRFHDPDQYVFVIETNSYAGNFEREMCAHITGQVGECGVGSEIAKKADLSPSQRDVFEFLLLHMPDDHGCHRPVSIGGPENQWVEIFLEAEPPEELLKLLMDRAKSFPGDDDLKILGFRLMTREVVTKTLEQWPVS